MVEQSWEIKNGNWVECNNNSTFETTSCIISEWVTWFESKFDRVICSQMAFEEWPVGEVDKIYEYRKASGPFYQMENYNKYETGPIFRGKYTRATHVMLSVSCNDELDAINKLFEEILLYSNNELEELDSKLDFLGVDEVYDIKILFWRRKPTVYKTDDGIYKADCRLSVSLDKE